MMQNAQYSLRRIINGLIMLIDYNCYFREKWNPIECKASITIISVSFFFRMEQTTFRQFVSVEFFLNNTNLTFLAFLYKIDIEGFQN